MKFFSIPQAAEELGVGYYRIYRAIKSYHVIPIQAGHSRLLTKADLNTLRQLFARREHEQNHAVR